MSLKDNTVFAIADFTMKQVNAQLHGSISPLIFEHKKIEQSIQTKLQEKQSAINMLGKDIDIEHFNKFLKAPQINDLLRNYLVYLLWLNIAKSTSEIKIFEDGVINYFLKTIEKYYPQLSKDESIVSIKQFFCYLTEICTGSFNDSIYSGQADKIIIQFHESIKKLPDKIIAKIEFGINHDFVQPNHEFEKIKTEYTKNLKQYYQNGFIYLLGEYKFNDFYIPPILKKGKSHNERRYFYIDLENLNGAHENWVNLFDNKDIIYVIGGAGYGKSLFLKNLINNYSKLSITNSQDYLVIYCDLKTYYTNGPTNKKTMVDFFQESMINTTGMDCISKDFVQYYLNTGRCLVLLDALDEVPKDVRTDLHKK